MQIDFDINKKALIIGITGEIDHHTSEDIRDRIDRMIDANSIRNIVFDFSMVSFMDSAGIGVVIGRYKKVSALGGEVAIAGVTPQVKRILEISGVLRIAKLFDSVKDALIYM